MDSAQVEKDTAALQNYVQQMKNIKSETERAEKASAIFDETLKDSSKIAQDVARNTNNLDDVMKVYTASTRTATSVAKSFGKALWGIGKAAVIALAVSAAITLASKGIQWAYENKFHKYEVARDKAAEMSQEHKEAAQNVENLTKQIEELKAKMDECRSTTTGKIVDQESLNLLKQQKDMLETNLKLAQQLEDIAAKSALAKAKAQYH